MLLVVLGFLSPLIMATLHGSWITNMEITPTERNIMKRGIAKDEKSGLSIVINPTIKVDWAMSASICGSYLLT